MDTKVLLKLIMFGYFQLKSHVATLVSALTEKCRTSYPLPEAPFVWESLDPASYLSQSAQALYAADAY